MGSSSVSGDDRFCLRWNDFEANISSAFQELRASRDFFDVTLTVSSSSSPPPSNSNASLKCGQANASVDASDDDDTDDDADDAVFVRAHQLVLSACSPFFRRLLRRCPSQHQPVIFLRGVREHDLRHVLDFMYNGQVSVSQSDLPAFLALADDLKIKGLADRDQRPSQATGQSAGANHGQPDCRKMKRDATATAPSPLAPSSSAVTPMMKRPRFSSPMTTPDWSGAQPLPPSDAFGLKPPVAALHKTLEQRPKPPSSASHENSVLVNPEDVSPFLTNMETPGNNFSSLSQMSIPGSSAGGVSSGGGGGGGNTTIGGGTSGNNLTSCSGGDSSGTNASGGGTGHSRTSLEPELALITRSSDGKGWQCCVCYKVADRKYNLQKHITAMHVTCDKLECSICGALLKNRNTLQNHMSSKHRPGGKNNVKKEASQ